MSLITTIIGRNAFILRGKGTLDSSGSGIEVECHEQ